MREEEEGRHAGETHTGNMYRSFSQVRKEEPPPSFSVQSVGGRQRSSQQQLEEIFFLGVGSVNERKRLEEGRKENNLSREVGIFRWHSVWYRG